MAIPETDYRFSDNIDVRLIDQMGGDGRIVAAARVSTQGSAAEDAESAGLIRFLMENRHGSPFEHVLFTWRVTAPIFVWREHHRHRIASYNEESGRYKQLDPHFYIPARNRNLVQAGKPGHYEFVPGSDVQYDLMVEAQRESNMLAYRTYEYSLELGIAKEVSRMALPVNIMSTCYVTMNARALMNFLSLRTKREGSHFPSFPQREIEMVAEKYEETFFQYCPLTYVAFVAAGRVAP